MSYYYGYRLGYLKDNKIYPLFPFSVDGTWEDIISRSRSYGDELHELFDHIPVEMVSDELKSRIVRDLETPEDRFKENLSYWKWLRFSDLPIGSYIKTGYFLINDVLRYESEPGEYIYPSYAGLFYDKLSPNAYIARMNTYQLTKQDGKKDEDGDWIERPVYDYMYYAYPDYGSDEYAAAMIRSAASMCDMFCYDNKAELVVIDVEG